MYQKINIVLEDITKIKVDAIVNAANELLVGGAGVDEAIHKAAGPQLLEECKKLNGCKTGEAKITKGYNLPAKYVIHTVGPLWLDGMNPRVKNDLENCYKNSLELAGRYNLKSIAFPSISTGDFGVPIEFAGLVAIKTVREFLKKTTPIQEVMFVLFSEGDYTFYKNYYESKAV